MATKTKTKLEPLIEGTWVRLGGDQVPDRLQGHLAVITFAPVTVVNDPKSKVSPRPYEDQDEDAVFTVRTRDEYSEELSLSRDSFTAISRNGRAALTAHG